MLISVLIIEIFIVILLIVKDKFYFKTRNLLTIYLKSKFYIKLINIINCCQCVSRLKISWNSLKLK